MKSEVPSELDDGVGPIGLREMNSLKREFYVDLERFRPGEMKTTEDIDRVAPENLEVAQMREDYAQIPPG